jgi:hypothetical protein
MGLGNVLKVGVPKADADLQRKLEAEIDARICVLRGSLLGVIGPDKNKSSLWGLIAK